MAIKHSKYKNTGLLFEFLVKQVAVDTIENKDSPAIKLLKKYFGGNSELAKEYKLYETVIKNKGVSEAKAERVINSVLEVSKRLSQRKLRKLKYDFINEVKENFNLEEFVTIKVENYKTLAALYCLLEAHNGKEVVSPEVLITNKTTILEHLTQVEKSRKEVQDSLIEQYSKSDKDLKLLTYKILLEKFNDKYKNFLPEQKRVLKDFILSASSSVRLRNTVNEQLEKIKQDLRSLVKKASKDKVLEIKLNQVIKEVKLLENNKKPTDKNLVDLLQYYELINELRSL